MDNQYHAPEVLFYLDSLHILYSYALPYEHEFIGKVKRMNRTIQHDEITCALKISVLKLKIHGCLSYRMF